MGKCVPVRMGLVWARWVCGLVWGLLDYIPDRVELWPSEDQITLKGVLVERVDPSPYP